MCSASIAPADCPNSKSSGPRNHFDFGRETCAIVVSIKEQPRTPGECVDLTVVGVYSSILNARQFHDSETEMRYFLDAEYNGFGRPLISLALVPEDQESPSFYEALPCA